MADLNENADFDAPVHRTNFHPEAITWLVEQRSVMEPLFLDASRGDPLLVLNEHQKLWMVLTERFNTQFPKLAPCLHSQLVERWDRQVTWYKRDTRVLAENGGVLPEGRKKALHFAVLDQHLRHLAHPRYQTMMPPQPGTVAFRHSAGSKNSPSDLPIFLIAKDHRRRKKKVTSYTGPSDFLASPKTVAFNARYELFRCMVPGCLNTSQNTLRTEVRFVTAPRVSGKRRNDAARKELFDLVGVPYHTKYYAHVCTRHYDAKDVNLDRLVPVVRGALPLPELMGKPLGNQPSQLFSIRFLYKDAENGDNETDDEISVRHAFDAPGPSEVRDNRVGDKASSTLATFCPPGEADVDFGTFSQADPLETWNSDDSDTAEDQPEDFLDLSDFVRGNLACPAAADTTASYCDLVASDQLGCSAPVASLSYVVPREEFVPATSVEAQIEWLVSARIDMDPLFRSVHFTPINSTYAQLWRDLAKRFHDAFPDVPPLLPTQLRSKWAKRLERYREDAKEIVATNGKLPRDPLRRRIFRMLDLHFRHKAPKEYVEMMENQPGLVLFSDPEDEDPAKDQNNAPVKRKKNRRTNRTALTTSLDVEEPRASAAVNLEVDSNFAPNENDGSVVSLRPTNTRNERKTSTGSNEKNLSEESSRRKRKKRQKKPSESVASVDESLVTSLPEFENPAILRSDETSESLTCLNGKEPADDREEEEHVDNHTCADEKWEQKLRRCIVPGCSNTNRNCDPVEVRFAAPPRHDFDPERRRLWFDLCKAPYNTGHISYVCTDHFAPEDVNRESVPLIKRGALPLENLAAMEDPSDQAESVAHLQDSRTYRCMVPDCRNTSHNTVRSEVRFVNVPRRSHAAKLRKRWFERCGVPLDQKCGRYVCTDHFRPGDVFLDRKVPARANVLPDRELVKNFPRRNNAPVDVLGPNADLRRRTEPLVSCTAKPMFLRRKPYHDRRVVGVYTDRNRLCLVPCCSNTTRSVDGISTVMLPLLAHPETAKLYRKAAGVKSSGTARQFICSDHFEKPEGTDVTDRIWDPLATEQMPTLLMGNKKTAEQAVIEVQSEERTASPARREDAIPSAGGSLAEGPADETLMENDSAETNTNTKLAFQPQKSSIEADLRRLRNAKRDYSLLQALAAHQPFRSRQYPQEKDYADCWLRVMDAVNAAEDDASTHASHSRCKFMLRNLMEVYKLGVLRTTPRYQLLDEATMSQMEGLLDVVAPAYDAYRAWIAEQKSTRTQATGAWADGKLCAAWHCSNFWRYGSKPENERVFFHVPVDTVVKRQWGEVLKRELNPKSNYVVCRNHFDPASLNEKGKLIRGCLPDPNLCDDPDDFVPGEDETATAPSSLSLRPEFEGTPEDPVTGNALPKQSRIHCIIAACPYRSDTARRASLAFVRCFRKPNLEDPASVQETSQKWVEAIVLENPQKIGRRHMICQSHFHESDFARFGKQPALKKHAYPRLKLLGSDWPYVTTPRKPQKSVVPAAVPKKAQEKAIVTTAKAQPKASAPRVEFFRVPRVQSSRKSLSDGASRITRLAQKPKKRKLRNLREEEEEDAESTESDGSEELSNERGWSRSDSSGSESPSQQEVLACSASPGFSTKGTEKTPDVTGVRRSARLSTVATGKNFRDVSSYSEEETTEKFVVLHGQNKADVNRTKDSKKSGASKRKAEEKCVRKRGGKRKKADHFTRDVGSELGLSSKGLENDLLDTGLPGPEDLTPTPCSESMEHLRSSVETAVLSENSELVLADVRDFSGAAEAMSLPESEEINAFAGAVWLDETMENSESLAGTSAYFPVAEPVESMNGGLAVLIASGILGSHTAVGGILPQGNRDPPSERASENPAHCNSVSFARSTGLPEFQVEEAGAERSKATWLEYAEEDSGSDLCDQKFSWSNRDPSSAERSRTDLWSAVSSGNFVPPNRDQDGTKWSMKRDANVVLFSRIRERTCGCCDAVTADHIVVKKDLSFFLWSGDPSSSPVHDLHKQSGTVRSMEQLTGCFHFDFAVFDHAHFVKKTQTFKFRL